MKKMLYIILAVFLALFIFYKSGPKVAEPNLSSAPYSATLPSNLEALEDQIKTSEENMPGVKEDNEARIIWADSFHYKKSPYSLVYLHGFSASQGEGYPVHESFGKRYGCNMYFARLQAHGLDNAEPMLELEPAALLESAKEAVAIGKMIGEKVIVMSTSTGGTLSLYLAAGDPDIHAQILYSPNIEIRAPGISLLTEPWGLQLVRLISGGKYSKSEPNEDPRADQYWTSGYRLEAVVNLKALVNATMIPSTFVKVKQPTLLVYYYKDEENQDQTVSVAHMLEMYDQLQTPDQLKRKVALTDVGVHPLASDVFSEDIEGVKAASFSFAEEILKLKPIE